MYPVLNFVVAQALGALDMIAVAAIATFWIMTPLNIIAIPIVALGTSWRYIMIVYWSVYYIFYWITFDLPFKGGAPNHFCRSCWPWSKIRDYFSHRIVKTAELPPDRNYIIGSHPHGALTIGGTMAFLGKVSGFDELFPGLSTCMITLDGQFTFPWRREAAMLLGAVSCSEKSLEYIFKIPGRGRAVTIAIGGLSEALMSRCNQHNIKIRGRKGFIRQALLYGASLVPCYHFGENQLYEMHRGADEQRLKNIIARLRNTLGFVPPLLKGRSLFGSPFGGLFPFRRPVTSVIGAPIHVEVVDKPTQEQVDELHERYCKALYDLFEEHKANYNISSDTHLYFF